MAKKKSIDLEYRPDIFERVIGNDKEIEAFKNNLDKEDGKHCYVISGPPGTGKTTIGRIGANYLGANKLDIYEYNTGSTRGIDTVRDIIDKMKHSMGGVKVFLIDEAHGLSVDGIRAFLKPTEEPPDHVYIFFITTDPAKLFKGDQGKALKRRLVPVKMTGVTDKELYLYLKKIRKKATIEVSDEVLHYISENSEGSPGTALMLLGMVKDLDEDDQMDKLENHILSNDPEVFEMGKEFVYNSRPNWKKISKYLTDFKKTKDPEEIRRILMGMLQTQLWKDGKSRTSWKLECLCDYQYSSGFPGITLAIFNGLHPEIEPEE